MAEKLFEGAVNWWRPVKSEVGAEVDVVSKTPLALHTRHAWVYHYPLPDRHASHICSDFDYRPDGFMAQDVGVCRLQTRHP